MAGIAVELAQAARSYYAKNRSLDTTSNVIASMSSRRRWLVALGCVFTTASTWSCKLDSLSVRTLRVRQSGDGAQLARMVVGTPSYVGSDADLGGVRPMCAKDLTVELDAPNPRNARIAPTTTTEVHLFGRSPTRMHDFLASLDHESIKTGLQATVAQRPAGAWHPQAATPGGFPDAPALVASSTSAIGATAARVLAGDAFWGAGPPAAGLANEVTSCRPAGGNTTVPGGSVQAVIAYSRGVCSREVAYAQLVGSGHRVLVDAIHGANQGGIGSNTITYSILNSYVRHEGGVLDAPTGGLFLLLHVVSRDLVGNAPSASWGKVRYELGLSRRGTLEIRPTQLGWRHDEGWGRILSEGLPPQFPGLRTHLTAPSGMLVTTLQALMVEQQLVGVQSDVVAATLSGADFDCDPANHVPACKRAASTLAGTLAALIRARKDPADPRKNLFTEAEIERMQCAIGDPEACSKLGKDADGIVAQRWACMKSRRSPEREHCDLIAPISRLLPTPDGMISVFFDDEDLENPAYVLEAAAPGSLCAPPSPPSNRRYMSNVIEDGAGQS